MLTLKISKSRLFLLLPLLAAVPAHSEEPEYFPPTPEIHSISPQNGYTRGGMRITLSGANLVPGIEIWLGSAPCTDVVFIPPTQIQCVAAAHPSGTVNLVAKTPRAYLIKKHFFTYVPDLLISPAYIPLVAGTTKKFSASGGTPPYKFSLLQGTGQLDPANGTLIAPPGPEFGVVQVSDSHGVASTATYRSLEKLKAYPESSEIDPDQSITLAATGGEPPYSFELVSGPGKLYPDRRIFVAGSTPGESVIRITDSSGTEAQMTVTVHKPDAPPPRLVAVGDNFSCAAPSGAVSCWGSNGFHQLGPNSRTSSFALPLESLSSGVESIVAGMHHACVLSEGAVKCWGDNQYGQLGSGTASSAAEPTQVLGLESGVWAIAAGDFHTCAALSHKIVCWGRNDFGQLGDGTSDASPVPVLVSNLEGKITGLAAGAFHTCAIVNGSAKCWGKNQNGQLGTGNQVDQQIPADVKDLTNVSSISAGRAHTCAVADGHLKCWGFNGIGNLGLNSDPLNSKEKNKSTPYEVQLAGATLLASHQYHSCAISNASLYCWGYNYQGQVGDSSYVNRWAPVMVKGLTQVKDVATGNSHTCAINDAGEVYCWGENYFGQLGNGQNAQQITPVRVKTRKNKKR